MELTRKIGCGKKLGIKKISPNNFMNKCGKGVFLCGKCGKKIKDRREAEDNLKEIKIGDRWFGSVSHYENTGEKFIPFTEEELKSLIKSIQEEARNSSQA